MSEEQENTEDQESEEDEEDEEYEGEYMEEEPVSDLAATGRFVAPVLEQDESAFQTLEQTAELAPSVSTQQEDDNFSYETSGGSKSYTSDFSEYESSQEKKYASEESSRRAFGRDLVFDEAASRPTVGDAFDRSGGAQNLQNIQMPASQQQMSRGEFEEQQQRYQEQLREESGPAFRRRQSRENRIR